ncbi:hypothetical protein CapIbe_014009 [Capra ibex]
MKLYLSLKVSCCCCYCLTIIATLRGLNLVHAQETRMVFAGVSSHRLRSLVHIHLRGHDGDVMTVMIDLCQGERPEETFQFESSKNSFIEIRMCNRAYK